MNEMLDSYLTSLYLIAVAMHVVCCQILENDQAIDDEMT
jgi:hypothetical protein